MRIRRVSHSSTQSVTSYLQGALYEGSSSEASTLKDSGQVSCSGHTCHWRSELLGATSLPAQNGFQVYVYAYGNYIIHSSEAQQVTTLRPSDGIYTEVRSRQIQFCSVVYPSEFYRLGVMTSRQWGPLWIIEHNRIWP